jgi:MFS family permease
MRAMTAVIAAMFAMIFMLFYEPVLTPYIAVTREWTNEDNVGYFLAIGALTYAFSSPLVGYLCTITKRRYITCFSFINCAIAMFLLGPSHVLSFPKEFGFTIAGIAYLGFSSGFINTPLLPEIISAV